MTGAFTSDPQFEALLREVAGVSLGAGAVEPPLPAGTVLGPYRLVEVVGAGGMGVVYRAFDERLAREVALKLLPKSAGIDAAARQQLLDEARAAAALSHPNLASVYEAGVLDEHSYFAMELVRGSSLRALIGSGEGTGPERLGWALAIARGLGAMHRAGWLHRDVKPENVMVTADGTAKLLDLGLAAQQGTRDGVVAGTPGYMSPEQRNGEALDARTDVYAFGQLLGELIAPGDRTEDLVRVVRRCIEPDRERRFASALEVVAALESLRHDPRRASAWVWLAAAMAVVFAATLVFLARRAPPVAVAHPARRLTGNAMSRPISDAALSRDGRTFAFVDDDGLTLGDVDSPERAQRLPMTELALAIEPGARSGFSVITSGSRAGEKALVQVDAKRQQRVYSGTFKFASLSPEADRVVTVEGARVVVRRAKDGAELSAVIHPKTRMLHAARWSPNAPLYALAYSERVNGERLRTLEVWAIDGKAPLWALRSQRLAQAYVPIVFAWSARGGLLYALADEPGTGNGSSVWSLAEPEAAPQLVAPIEGQFLSGLGQAEDGALLTVRETAHLRVQLADVAADGSLARQHPLSASELDERPTGWSSPSSVLLMSFRELVPHLARRELEKNEPQWLEGKGWAQTWPTASAAGLLYWWAEKPAADAVPRWNLALREGTAERALRLPAPALGQVSTISAPPHNQRVHCAAAVKRCVLAVEDGDDLSFYELGLDGAEPRLRSKVTSPGLGPLWALSADGERIALAEDDAAIRVLGPTGAELSRRPIAELVDVRGLAFDAAGDGFYVSGMGRDGLQCVGHAGHEGPLEVFQRSPSAYAELQLAPDGRGLAFLEKEFDSDLWLTPSR